MEKSDRKVPEIVFPKAVEYTDRYGNWMLGQGEIPVDWRLQMYKTGPQELADYVMAADGGKHADLASAARATNPWTVLHNGNVDVKDPDDFDYLPKTVAKAIQVQEVMEASR